MSIKENLAKEIRENKEELIRQIRATQNRLEQQKQFLQDTIDQPSSYGRILPPMISGDTINILATKTATQILIYRDMDGEDRMTDKELIVESIKNVIRIFHPSNNSADNPYKIRVFMLLLGTAAVETGLRNIAQKGGPARGAWQVEPTTAKWLLEEVCFGNKYKDIIKRHDLTYGSQAEWEKRIMSDLFYGCALARLKYLTIPCEIPYGIASQAEYWKQYYNTPLGKGTIKHYLDAWINNSCDAIVDQYIKEVSNSG